MFQDPDLDVKYRKGGKIMKKASKPSKLSMKPIRKFSEGGEGVDWVPQVKYKNLGDFFRGKRMEEAKPAEAAPEAPRVRDRGDRFLAQTQAAREGQDAVNASKAADIPSFAEPSSYGSQAEQDAPKGITGGENVVTEVKKPAPKAVAPKRFAPKAAPRKAAPSPRKAGNDPEPYVRREEQTEPMIGGKKPERKYNPQRAAVSAAKDYEVLKSLGRRLLTTSSGQNVSGFAKGGGVEAKGKTKGKVVKMAKGGSVKGWGIARGSRATKMV